MSAKTAQLELIAALATPCGGAIGIVRLSGEGSLAVFTAMTGIAAPQHAKMQRCALVNEHGEALDDAMAVFFFAPNSYTGENSCELHLHGSAAVMRRALAAAVALGARVAEPGEFTRRAFMAGKLKLSEAEAVMDEINSETDRGAKTALLQLRGALTRRVLEIEDALGGALAAIDAAIDYPEELEDDVLSALPAVLAGALKKLDALILEGERGRAVREGARVVLLGAPNAGKSTLLNALAGDERAIVTAEAGTTRDILEAKIVIDGVPVTLVDTAGLRAAQSEPERIGVARAKAAAKSAELVLLVVDASAADAFDGHNAPDMSGMDGLTDAPVIWVYTKADIAGARSETDADKIFLSALTGYNLPALRAAIASALKLDAAVTAEYPAVTNIRHISALKAARAALEGSSGGVPSGDTDLLATDIRTALVALGAISGSDIDEKVIEEIFSKFCVGK